MKRNKILKKLLSVSLAAVLSLGGMVTAFAADPSPDDNVKILKELKMDESLEIPTGGLAFSFTFTAKEYNGVTATSSIVNGEAMPTVGPVGITVPANTTGTNANGMDSYKVESDKIFKDVVWQAPGVYTYTVAETASTTSTVPSNATIDYSTTSYEVTAYVKNDGAGGFVVAQIGVKKDNGSGTLEKVEVTPGLTTNEFAFVNEYSESAGGTDPTTDPALKVSKTVTGAYGDQNKYFDFAIDTTASASETAGTTTYKAYVIDTATSDVVSLSDGKNDLTATGNDTYGDYVEVLAGTTLNVKLKHGQHVAFVGMGAGSKYDATEGAATNYIPSISVIVNGGTANAVNGLTTGERIIGAAANSAAYTNAYNDGAITPTGITTNDIPFIGMIVLAMGALVAFVVVKTRKKAGQN